MEHQNSILIVHPDIEFCDKIKKILSAMKCHLNIMNEDDAVPQTFQLDNYRVCIVHENFICPKGRSILDILKNNGRRVPVILISEQGDLNNAVNAIRNGAHDYLVKTGDGRIIEESLRRACEMTTQKRETSQFKGQGEQSRPIVTCSDKMNDVLNIAQRIAGATATVMIQGESGTGKELLARFIHEHSQRSNKVFVAMNCAALPENLAESELFGYEKGAFTGAVHSRMGKFEKAHGGTLLLDEISEMPLSLQVKLLRVLQEKEVDPIGSRKPTAVDVRVIATSNRDLKQMVQKGTFRSDLYYRLRVIPLTIPALRERKEDIPLLVDFFVQKFATAYSRADVRFSDEAMERLSSWTWAGNVRELENTVERAILICDGPVIGTQHLLLDQEPQTDDNCDSQVLVGMTVKEMERKLIGQTLKQVNDNRTHAAKMLGISIRTLRNKLHEYDHSKSSPLKNASAS